MHVGTIHIYTNEHIRHQHLKSRRRKLYRTGSQAILEEFWDMVKFGAKGGSRRSRGKEKLAPNL